MVGQLAWQMVRILILSYPKVRDPSSHYPAMGNEEVAPKTYTEIFRDQLKCIQNNHWVHFLLKIWNQKRKKRLLTTHHFQLTPNSSVCVAGTAVTPQRRSSTSAIWRAVGRCTARRPTWGPTCAGTPARGRLSVTGSSVARGSPGVTSCRDTEEHTQVGNRYKDVRWWCGSPESRQ